MSNTSASFHAITSISVKYQELPPGGCLNFTFRDASGGYHDITAHVEKPIAIDGAEFINFVASHEVNPSDSLEPLLRASIEQAKAKKGAHHE